MNNIYTLQHSLNAPFGELLSIIHQAVTEQNIAFFLAGATARDIVLHHVFDRPKGRRTYDIDTAILISGWQEFKRVKQGLIAQGMRETREIHRVIHTNTGMPVDIIPFGAISNEQGDITWPPEHSVVMSVAGFQQAYDSSLSVDIGNNCLIKVASIAGLALLKLIAWCDRQPETYKDAEDFLTLITQYEHIQTERLFDEYVPAESLNYNMQRAGAYLLGHDIALILKKTKYHQLHLVRTELNERFTGCLVKCNSDLNLDLEQLLEDFWRGTDQH